MTHHPCCRKPIDLHDRFFRLVIGVAATLTVATLSASTAVAQNTRPHRNPPPTTHLMVPASSQTHDADYGLRAHTNIRVLSLSGKANPKEAPPYLGYGYETPASLACIYRLVRPIRGCNPNETTNTPDGGSESIAIVDAFHDPNAAADLEAFSTQFGLPYEPSKFQVVYSSGSQPPVDPTGGWELEESLDIEYAHAMAPRAMLYLVEAPSNSFNDLFNAVVAARNLVRCGQTTACPAGSHGKGEVSMSWGGSEFPQETLFDSIFTGTDVVYVASSGDSPGVIYPAASPNVLAAGGTSTARSLDTGDLIQEIAWSDGGGGASQYEPRPSYQNGIAWYTGASRATPDLSTDSNPATGVWVYDSNPYDGAVGNPWWIVGGTSAASPTIAGILNAAATESGHFAASTAAELTRIYSQIGHHRVSENFWDISYGACNYYSGSFSMPGYDFCTGVGSPRGLEGK